MSISRRLFPLALLLATACAHEQPMASTPPPPPPPPAVAEPTPAQPPAPPVKASGNVDLAALLSQPISHFAFDKALLTSEDEQQLQTLADALKANPSARIQIAGNCDERGTEEYNLQLGQQRAAAAKRYLTDLGVEPARLETISYGKDRPLEPGHDEQAWAANRRDDATKLNDVSAR